MSAAPRARTAPRAFLAAAGALLVLATRAPATEVVVEAPPALSREARAVKAAVVAALPDLEAFFGDTLDGTIRVLLVPTRAAFVEATGGRVPTWAVGVALPERGLVVVQGAGAAPAGTDPGRVAVHEVVHLFVDAAGGDEVPRWLDEGIAVYLSGEDRGASFWDLARALVADRALYLDEISARFPPREEAARLAYYESLTAVQFVARRWGAASIPDLLRAIRESGYEDAFVARYGMTPDEFDAEWDRDLRHRTRWVGWTAEGFPFAAVVTLLFFAAVVRKRLAARRRIAEWEREERERARGASPGDAPDESPDTTGRP